MMFVSLNSNTMGIAGETGTANPSIAPEFPLFLVRFVLLNLWFSRSCFVDHCPFNFGHYVVRPSSIYGF